MTTEKEHEGMLEALYLLRSPANAERLLRSIESADARRLTEHELIKARPMPNEASVVEPACAKRKSKGGSSAHSPD
jgi:hypothetical protein